MILPFGVEVQVPFDVPLLQSVFFLPLLVFSLLVFALAVLLLHFDL